MKKKTNNERTVKTPWYGSYGDMPRNLEYKNISLYTAVLETSYKHPDLIAYNYFGVEKTYKEFIEEINECARALKAIGIKKNDAVTICMPNTPEGVISFYAINMIGAVANMVHPLSSENEIKYYLNVSNSVALITIDISWEKVAEIINETKVKNTIIVSVKDSMPKILGFGYYITKGRKVKRPKTNGETIYWKQFIIGGKNYLKDCDAKLLGDARAAILYSGGTTGTPKGIVLSNLNFNSLALQGITACGGLDAGDSILAIMPIFHGFGLGICIHTVMYLGGKAILQPQFSAKTFDKLLKTYRPNIIAGVPTLYEALLKNKRMENVDLSFLKIVISGGDSLSVSLKKKIDVFLKEHNSSVQVREGYGLTECVTGTCLTPRNEYREGSIGIPYPDTYYKIVKPNTHTEVDYGVDGEICLSGPTLMIEYLNEPKETAHTLQLHDDGMLWLHTGDLGCMDEDGWVYFKQRIKRMIISSGYSIYPQHIENVIDGHPDVLMSTVIGIDHPYKVQVIKAFIVLKNGVEATEEVKKSIYEYCEKNIAKYSMPYAFEYRDALPKTLVGKVAYTKLIEEENNKE
ncbi:MAG: AMP-binding protein [Bacilli bacterium]|nr:AMP-binding protein [Bacilli bacterium]MDD4283143.1 AMP-binding protein [Bacilli bacterium]MDD4719119.1 AMP-binding protein [Bacilli bacterium]